MTQVSGVSTGYQPMVTAGASGTSGSSGTAGPGTTSGLVGNNEMDQDMFLKLLVAQLKYQDPSSPTDPTKFLTETAQFTVVEKLADLSKLNQQVLETTRSQSASALVGKSVTYTDAAGATRTGTVTGTTLGSSPTLTVSGVDVAYDAVKSVGTTSAAPTT